MKKIIYIILCLMVFENIFAQTVTWKRTPHWESAEVFGENMLKIKQFGKWGIVSFSGSEIIPCENARITDICEGHFLVLDENNKIISLRDKKCNTRFLTDKKRKALTGDWFVDPSWPYFSEGLLAVKDSKGEWGFIDTSGQLIIKKGFSKVYPFHYGFSAVKNTNGNWYHIDKEGTVVRNDKNLGQSIRTYISSFTQIGKEPLSIVYVNDKIYLIDIGGNILGNIFPKSGVPCSYFSENDSTISFSKDDFSIVFNNKGEIMFIKNSDNIYTSTLKENPVNISQLNHEGIEIEDPGLIRVDSLLISPQFQKIIPLSGSLVLVKKDNKWGILEIDRNQALVKITCKKPFYTSLDSELGFDLSGNLKDIRIYTHDNQNKTVYFEVTDRIFSVPTKYMDKNGQITLGIEENGILVEPVEYTVPQRILEKNNYNVTISSSTIEVKDGESANINITVHNEAPFVVSYSIYVNGELYKNGITDREVKLQHRVRSLDFGTSDLKKINIKIEIKEEGVPGSLSYPKSYSFKRKYNI